MDDTLYILRRDSLNGDEGRVASVWLYDDTALTGGVATWGMVRAAAKRFDDSTARQLLELLTGRYGHTATFVLEVWAAKPERSVA